MDVVNAVVLLLARLLPSLRGQMAEILGSVWDHTRSSAEEQVAGESVSWVRRVLQRAFGSQRPEPDQPSVPTEVADAIHDLAANPSNRSAHRLLVHLITHRLASDPSLAGDLAALLAAAPAEPPDQASFTGDVRQSTVSGAAVANTGVVGDITINHRS